MVSSNGGATGRGGWLTGLGNSSNVMTKHVGREEIEMQCGKVGMEMREGRSYFVPALDAGEALGTPLQGDTITVGNIIGGHGH